VPKNSLFKSLTSFSFGDVGALFTKARRIVANEQLELRRGPTKREGFGRILIIIPKGVGSAPIRNLLRRRIKHIFFEEELYKIPHDWILIVRKPAAEMSFDQLKLFLKKWLCTGQSGTR
jgi:ribonuclease P protein component